MSTPDAQPCKHPTIQTFRFADTGEPAGLWACADCRRKFAPLDVESAAEIERLPAVAAPAVASVTPSIKETVLAQFKDAEVSILALAEKYRAVAFDVTTTKGMNEAKAARLELREKGRFAVQRQPLSEDNGAAVRPGDEAPALINKAAAALRLPGIAWTSVFRSAAARQKKVFAYSAHPVDSSMLVRESEDGTQAVGRFDAEGRFRVSRKAT